MKAFFIGLLFLAVAVVLAGLGILLFPLLIVMGWILQFLLMFGFTIFAIWALGKLIIFVWEQSTKKGNNKLC